MFPPRKLGFTLFSAGLVLLFFYTFHRRHPAGVPSHISASQALKAAHASVWRNLRQQNPVELKYVLPTSRPRKLPKIQYKFHGEAPEEQAIRLHRLEIVRENLAHAWKGYCQYAWGNDEVAPLTGHAKNTFGGWAATLVDSLDTLWIAGLKDEFHQAVDQVSKLDFTKSSHTELNVFETTIRYLGGFLSAYDLSGRPELLIKAVELGDMMYVAFDTPNRMPITRWLWEEYVQLLFALGNIPFDLELLLNFSSALNGKFQEAHSTALSAEIGSLSLEFTRLSQVTGDSKYFDAIQRVTDVFRAQQDQTALPGMWSVAINANNRNFSEGRDFSLGAMADSLYEYLPKMYLLTGGLLPEYAEMYGKVLARAKESLFFRPMTKDDRNVLMSGIAHVELDGPSKEAVTLVPDGQHLVCFVGGMVGIAAKLFDTPAELDTARRLVDGCIWAYEAAPAGIMPEVFRAVACPANKDGYDSCTWDETVWHEAVRAQAEAPYGLTDTSSVNRYITEHALAPGMAAIRDHRYILRPEAIESIFILYRITGDQQLREHAWRMFEAVQKHTRTSIAHAAIKDVTQLDKDGKLELDDRMESFWTAETLKYYYLLYSEPHVISLDDYVFNTEAHPFRRPV